MKHRKLRIAWSVAWGLLAVLLCVLWVRSYDEPYKLIRPNASRTDAMGILSNRGLLIVGRFELAHLAELHHQLFQEQIELIEQRGRSQKIAAAKYKITAIQREIAQYRTQLALSRTPPISRPIFPAVAVPHWLSLLLAATLAVAPWLRFRFSLRTMLIATTLVAVGLGLIVGLR